jgi:phosphoribosylformimino-5-aminoimidazole carboxamide ribotide isomerase
MKRAGNQQTGVGSRESDGLERLPNPGPRTHGWEGAALLLYPAIDLSGGRAVRLLRGERAATRVVAPDAVALARELVEQGAPFLHLVDIDAAFGQGNNESLVERIVASAGCPVQVGGGVRDERRARRLRAVGAARVVLGTAALRDHEMLARLVAADPDGVVVAADARAGQVVVAGWTESSGEDLGVFAARMRQVGVHHLLVTAVERDGTGQGPDHAVLRSALASFGPGVIASGGVGSVADVARLAPLAAEGLAGVIVGSLLVDHRATVAELLAVVGGTTPRTTNHESPAGWGS